MVLSVHSTTVVVTEYKSVVCGLFDLGWLQYFVVLGVFFIRTTESSQIIVVNDSFFAIFDCV